MLLDPGTPTIPVGTPSRPPERAIVQTADEMTDGFGEELTGGRTLGGGVDFFSSLGTEHRKKPPPKDVNAKVCSHLFTFWSGTDDLGVQPRMSDREMNRGEPEPEAAPKGPPQPGAPGSQWRMLKLKRTYQEAEEEGRPLEDVRSPSSFLSSRLSPLVFSFFINLCYVLCGRRSSATAGTRGNSGKQPSQNVNT